MQALFNQFQLVAKRPADSFLSIYRRLLMTLTPFIAIIFLLLSASSDVLATERDSLLNNGAAHDASWAYYTDSSNSRWYISQINANKLAVYSLGPIVNKQAGWWTVGEAAAKVNTASKTVTIDPNLDPNSSSTFYDIGLGQWLTNSSIHSDRQKIQGTTVPIKWYFFRAPNGSWYIVNAAGYGTSTQILRFNEINGQYDWPSTDTADFVPVFSVSATGTMSVRFQSSTPVDDHGNSIGAATAISANSGTSGNIEVAGDNDYFRIVIPTSGKLTVSTTGYTDTYGYLLDSNGQELNKDDESGGSPNFLINRDVGAGTYYVRVKNYYADRTGSYTLLSNFVQGTPSLARAVLLLHGLNSGPETWNDLVGGKTGSRWSGSCTTIYNGVLQSSTTTTDDTEAACYRIKFGRLDISPSGVPNLTGLEGVTCAADTRSASGQGCGGDYTEIFNNGVSDLGVEVKMAVAAIRARNANLAQVVLLGHSRGGLAARAFLQLPVSDLDTSTVVGLITTGTPHLGSPFGRIYARLRNVCSTGSARNITPAGCKDDWQGVDCLAKNGRCATFPSALDLRMPSIDRLSPESPGIVKLAQTSANLTARNIFFRRLAYQGAYLGHLGDGYSVWDRPWVPQSWDQFSNQSKAFLLCPLLSSCSASEDATEFLGDGIVPFDSQAVSNIAGLLITISGGSIFHTDEPKQLSQLNTELNRTGTWR